MDKDEDGAHAYKFLFLPSVPKYDYKETPHKKVIQTLKNTSITLSASALLTYSKLLTQKQLGRQFPEHPRNQGLAAINAMQSPFFLDWDPASCRQVGILGHTSACFNPS
ncbi:hypothetical protein ACJJTC_004305 [Scirpophaga incertulas]